MSPLISGFTWPRLALIAALLLTGCGGGDEGSGAGPPSPPPAPPPAPPPSTQSQVTVLVRAPEGTPLPGAKVNLYHPTQGTQYASGVTGADGRVRLAGVPAAARVSIWHPFGYRYLNQDFTEGAEHEVRLTAHEEVTVALMPAQIVSISPDRTELDVAITIVARRDARLQPSSYGGAGATPYVRLGDCWVWLDAVTSTPRCQYPVPGDDLSVVSYEYNAGGAPAWPGSQVPYSATLLLDQGQRSASYDPYDLRWPAARHFAARIKSGGAGSADRVSSLAGFAGIAADPAWMPLLLPPPAWSTFDPAAAFDHDPALREATLENLRRESGGASPVIEALHAVPRLLDTHAPPGRRTLVALLGGADDGPGDEQEVRAKLDELAAAHARAAIRSVIVSGRHAEASPERSGLADLAGALQSPLIVSGLPRDWRPELSDPDALWSALDLAADIVSGAPLATLKVVFRMRRSLGDPFIADSTLRAVLHVESAHCPMGCAELPLTFSVRIP